jgi:hypothetical protein
VKPDTFSGLSQATTITPKNVSTPTKLIRGLVGIGVTLALAWFIISIAIYETKTGVQTIGRDTAPSVVAAQQIRASLANLDASAINAALLRGTAATDAWTAYQNEERVLADYLVTAAQNITYGDDERNPIVDIASNLQVYADLIGQAREAIKTADPVRPILPNDTLAILRNASSIMNGKLLPAAAALNAANETVLETTWEKRKSAYSHNLLIIIPIVGLALASLIILQIFLAVRTRRRINPGLAGATIIIACTSLYIMASLGLTSNHLRIAKEDAFDSVRALWKARATLYSANADESYLLLDPSGKTYFTDQFAKKTGLIAGPSFLDPQKRANFVAAAKHWRDANCTPSPTAPKITDMGYFGDELANVTFENECAEAANLIPLFANYIAIDQQVRALENSGRHAEALTLNLGVNPGQSNYAFDKVNQELGLLIYINQMAFSASIDKATANLTPLPSITGSAIILAFLLAFFGLRPRLAEYHV